VCRLSIQVERTEQSLLQRLPNVYSAEGQKKESSVGPGREQCWAVVAVDPAWWPADERD